jgi:hypothetical protein
VKQQEEEEETFRYQTASKTTKTSHWTIPLEDILEPWRG